MIAMRYMIASDIHGSERYCTELLKAYESEGAERLLLLGDILYHGPRNDLPDGYAPKRVAELLNSRRGEVLCVRGNCDSEVDQMMLEFPIMAEYALLEWCGRTLFMTHGHHFSDAALPPLCRGDVLLFGHTHVPTCTEKDGIYCLNPGSVSIPKGGSERGYLIFDDGTFTRKAFSGAVGALLELSRVR